MKVKDLVTELGLTGWVEQDLEQDVAGGYAADLLSIVMAQARQGQVWVTLQRHQNVVAVAVLLELAAVVVAGGTEPDEDTLEKARQEGVNLLGTTDGVFEVVGKMYQLGVRENGHA